MREGDMSRRLSKPWRVVKWMGVVVTLTLVGLWVVSYWNVSAWFIRKSYGITVSLSSGCLYVNYTVYAGGGPRQPRNGVAAEGFKDFTTFWTLPFASNSGIPGYPFSGLCLLPP